MIGYNLLNMTYVWPISNMSPECSKDRERHGGRNQARKRYRFYCVPARLALFTCLYILCLQWSSGYIIAIASAGATILWCSYKIALDPKTYQIWWSRQYLLFESVCIVLAFSIFDTETAIHFSFALLLFHVLYSVLMAIEWPEEDTT